VRELRACQPPQLCYVVLCCAVLCCAVLCCVVSCSRAESPRACPHACLTCTLSQSHCPCPHPPPPPPPRTRTHTHTLTPPPLLLPLSRPCKVAYKPPDGALFVYDRDAVKFRKDAHDWQKRADGRHAREDHAKLKVLLIPPCLPWHIVFRVHQPCAWGVNMCSISRVWGVRVYFIWGVRIWLVTIRVLWLCASKLPLPPRSAVPSPLLPLQRQRGSAPVAGHTPSRTHSPMVLFSRWTARLRSIRVTLILKKIPIFTEGVSRTFTHPLMTSAPPPAAASSPPPPPQQQQPVPLWHEWHRHQHKHHHRRCLYDTQQLYHPQQQQHNNSKASTIHSLLSFSLYDVFITHRICRHSLLRSRACAGATGLLAPRASRWCTTFAARAIVVCTVALTQPEPQRPTTRSPPQSPRQSSRYPAGAATTVLTTKRAPAARAECAATVEATRVKAAILEGHPVSARGLQDQHLWADQFPRTGYLFPRQRGQRFLAI
jgi:hypothetical protein